MINIVKLKLTKKFLLVTMVLSVSFFAISFIKIRIPDDPNFKSNRPLSYMIGRLIGWSDVRMYSNGNIMVKAYFRGNLDNLELVKSVSYDINGCVRARVICGTGVSILYYNSGQIMSLETYFHGKKNSPCFEWKTNGLLNDVSVNRPIPTHDTKPQPIPFQ